MLIRICKTKKKKTNNKKNIFFFTFIKKIKALK